MKEIDEFLEFMFENIEDDRFEITKNIVSGYRIYAISLNIERIDNKKSTLTIKGIMSYNNILLTIDCQNKYIDLTVNMDSVLIESGELVKKWETIIEEHLNSKLDSTVKKLIDMALDKSDLSRDYKIKKIL